MLIMFNTQTDEVIYFSVLFYGFIVLSDRRWYIFIRVRTLCSCKSICDDEVKTQKDLVHDKKNSVLHIIT